MAKKVNNDFDLVNLPIEAQDPSISQDDFVLQQADKEIHEQKFQTKPTTFLKDSLRRFSKNKSSVVAAYILGVLVLLSIFVPIFDTNDVSQAQNPAFVNLQPKLFENANGFWDGTIKVEHTAVDVSNPDDPTTWLPDPALYKSSGITNLKYKGEEYTNVPDKYGKGGYFQFGYYGSNAEEGFVSSVDPAESSSPFTLDLSTSNLSLTSFVVVDEAQLRQIEGDETLTVPANYTLGHTSLEFVFLKEGEEEETVIELVEPALTQNITSAAPVDISTIIKDEAGQDSFTNFYFRIKVVAPDEQHKHSNIDALVKSFVITTDSADENIREYFSTTKGKLGETGICFTNAMDATSRVIEVGSGANTKTNYGYWSIDNADKRFKGVYLGKATFASFTYDTYKATLGERTITLYNDKFEEYRDLGYIDYDFVIAKEGGVAKIIVSESIPFTILDEKKCPIISTFEFSDVSVDQQAVGGEYTWSVTVDIIYYKYLGYEKMPTFLFGTDKNGRDMFKYVFEGLRNSLLLGVITFAVCFLFGLFWGAISGYFGGTVDLIMERVTDILSGVPWIVVMTLVILKAGSTFGTFVLALCLTGWIGTASTTRTQFYRFRGREYVLASRTLGASDARLISKHILPNAMGTIVTGAVLMIPSVIFSEATISYLGLGFKNLSSLGVILSNNQAELTSHPYQLIFPSVVIALIMISFNLFGNGLRDAINPSLKGEEE